MSLVKPSVTLFAKHATVIARGQHMSQRQEHQHPLTLASSVGKHTLAPRIS